MDLHAETLESESINTLNSISRQFCPECGAPMKEANRLSEDKVVYIWYRCSRGCCEGSWLQKT